MDQDTNIQDDLDWYKVEEDPFVPPPPPTMPENNHHHLPSPAAATLPPPENRLHTFPQIPINPYQYHPIQKTTFPNAPYEYDPSLAAYDPSFEADFNRLNLSTPSRINGQDRSYLRNLSDSGSQFDYTTDLNLQRMRVESAVRGQTGMYMDHYGFLDSGDDLVDGFQLTRLGPSSLSYGQYNNALAYYGIGGLNRLNNNRVNGDGLYEAGGYGNPTMNGFSSVYGTGYRAPAGLNNRNNFSSPAYDMASPSSTNGFRSGFQSVYGSQAGTNGFQSVYGANSNRNGPQVDNGFRRRGRPGMGSEPDKSGLSGSGGSRSPSANGGDHRQLSLLSERLNARPFEQWRGNIVFLAKDQHGYAILKKKIEEKNKEEIEMIFQEVKEHVRELMVDQYGNYPIQKIFEVCNEDQMTEMLLLVVREEHYLVSICVDTHGTRAMQKMLEHLTTPKQVSLVMSVISRIALVLTKSMSGYRVIERCLKSFTNEQNRQLLHQIADNCADIAMDQAGCCVLQQCVLYAEGEAQERLVSGIIANTLVLSENIYGNYVVQYILGLKVPHYTEKIMAQLAGSYVSLSMNKYGSNVVERCIRDSNDEQAARIIREIYDSPNFLMVLQDPFGNYVTQTALEIAKGGLRHAIITLILQYHQPFLRSHPHGKRVLAKAIGNGKHHRSNEFRR